MDSVPGPALGSGAPGGALLSSTAPSAHDAALLPGAPMGAAGAGGAILTNPFSLEDDLEDLHDLQLPTSQALGGEQLLSSGSDAGAAFPSGTADLAAAAAAAPAPPPAAAPAPPLQQPAAATPPPLPHSELSALPELEAALREASMEARGPLQGPPRPLAQAFNMEDAKNGASGCTTPHMRMAGALAQPRCCGTCVAQPRRPPAPPCFCGCVVG
jgi:hypothetical protein